MLVYEKVLDIVSSGDLRIMSVMSMGQTISIGNRVSL